MTSPVQVTFRNMRPSPELTNEARARAEWLETFYPRLVGCRVTLEIPHRHRAHGRPIHVRIELAVPGEDIVVSHEPALHAALKDAEASAAHKDVDIDGAH